ncbi:helix-turn-helix domain-containing protein [Acinetobacter baumannii]|uniref:AraC family transcriptional regulator n=1 Tax=Acinetobacter baumannii TaxID=470 RepID=UPI003F5F2D9B
MSANIKLPTAFWLAVERLSLSRFMLIKEADLPLNVARDDARITTLQFFKLWEALENFRGKHVGIEFFQVLDSGNLPPSFLVAYHAKNLRDAIRRISRFKTLCTPEELLLTEDKDLLCITIKWPTEQREPPRALIDVTIASLIYLAREGTQQLIQPAKLDLTRDTADVFTGFINCPIHCNSSENRVYFYQKDLDLSFPSYNDELLKILDVALEVSLNQQSTGLTVSEQVKWLLRRSLTAGRPELRSVAKELSISQRSLQRYLKNEGASFQALLSETRNQLACEYLLDSSLDIAEISYLLGYEEQGSFFRAFQEWENSTPTKWREVHLKEALKVRK